MAPKRLKDKILLQMNKYNDIANLISKRLDELSNFNSCSYSKLLEAEKYSLTAGGKHLRGIILIHTAMLGDANINATIDLACALEMVHTYSLIHDDLPDMDNDDLRRGKPTCHKVFGLDIALLAGDALITKAFNVICSIDNLNDTTKIKCIKILSDCCGEHGMLAGQTIDKLSEDKYLKVSELEELQARKTGDMFLAAIKIGCIVGNLPCEISKKLENYINFLGLAFQIKDDILDVTSSKDIIGKPVNSDKKQNKSTFVSLLGLEKAQLLLDKKVIMAKECLNGINDCFYLDLADYFSNRNK